MSTSAIVMMVVGIVVIWGGLLASCVHAYRASKKKNTENQSSPENIG